MSKLRFLLWITIAITFVFSCSDEVVKFDPRIQAEGDYQYYRTMYELDQVSGKLIPLGTSFNVNGVYHISKDLMNDSGMIVMEDGNTEFTLNGVTETYNGFSFGVPGQMFKENGNSHTITGYSGTAISTSVSGVTYYQGYYSSAAKIFEFWFEYVENGTTIVVQVKNMKK